MESMYNYELILGEKEYEKIYSDIEKVLKAYSSLPKEPIKAKIISTVPEIKSLKKEEIFIVNGYTKYPEAWLITNENLPRRINGLDLVVEISYDDQFSFYR